MPTWGRNNNNNNPPPSDDTSDCEYCANGLQCPYWYQDSDDQWWHDRSGAQGLLDNTAFNDTYDIWDALPDTPDPDSGGGKGKRKRNDDDDHKPRRFRLF